MMNAGPNSDVNKESSETKPKSITYTFDQLYQIGLNPICQLPPDALIPPEIMRGDLNRGTTTSSVVNRGSEPTRYKRK